MIYFDNAATTLRKPPCVARAVAEACLAELAQAVPGAAIIGYVTGKEENDIILE